MHSDDFCVKCARSSAVCVSFRAMRLRFDALRGRGGLMIVVLARVMVRVRHVPRDVVSKRFYIDSTYIHDNHTQKKRSGGEPTADAARQPAARPPHRPPPTHAHERAQAARTHSPSTLRPPGGRAQPSRALARLARPSGPSSSATNRRRARRHALAGTPARHLDDARKRPRRRRQEPQTAVKPPPGRPPPWPRR